MKNSKKKKKPIARKKPKKLYKYQGYSTYSLSNLKTSCIYFNSPNNFNDPYDCIHPINKGKLNLETALKLIVQFSNGKFDKSIIDKIKKKTISNKELINLYQFILLAIPNPIGFSLLKMDKKGKDSYFENRRDQLDDPEERMKTLKELEIIITKGSTLSFGKVIDEIRELEVGKLKVSCFSENLYSMQMWSYYADGHKGFCLEFDTSKDPFTRMIKIKYVNKPPRLRLDSLINPNNPNVPYLEAFMGVKHSSWRHEKEWRVFTLDRDGFFQYGPKALTGIYFGSNMKETEIEIICSIVKSQNENVKFYKMVKDKIEFKLKDVELFYESAMELVSKIKSCINTNFTNKKFSVIDIITKMGDLIDIETAFTNLNYLVDEKFIAVHEDLNYSKI